MANNLNLNSESLLDVKFSPAEKGYNPLQVDETLDKIISDYKAFEKELATLSASSAKKDEDIARLKSEIRKLEIEAAEAKKLYESLPKNGGVSQDNVKLLRKINIYERALWKKGIDPKKLLSDPDNC